METTCVGCTGGVHHTLYEGKPMATNNRRYLAFMLRLWQVVEVGKITWRASLEDAHTGERQGFVDLDALIEYLQRLMRGSPCDEEGKQDQDEHPCHSKYESG